MKINLQLIKIGLITVFSISIFTTIYRILTIKYSYIPGWYETIFPIYIDDKILIISIVTSILSVFIYFKLKFTNRK